MKLTENPPLIKTVDFSTQKKTRSKMVSVKGSKVSSRRKVTKRNQKDLVKSEIIMLNKSENKFLTKKDRNQKKSRSKTPGRKLNKRKKSLLFTLKKKKRKSRGVSVKKKPAVSKYLKNKKTRDKSNNRRMRTPPKTRKKTIK